MNEWSNIASCSRTRSLLEIHVATMKICCEPLPIWVANSGKSGTAILLKRIGNRLKFVCQSRAIDADSFTVLQRIAANGPLGDLKINIVTQQGISYCPFCGMQLDQLIEQLDVAEIAELESLHSRFICS